MPTGDYRMSPEKQIMPRLEIQFNRERLKKKAGISIIRPFLKRLCDSSTNGMLSKCRLLLYSHSYALKAFFPPKLFLECCPANVHYLTFIIMRLYISLQKMT